MQPYLFPYVGYFQLVASVDSFVFFDDVSFIKRGWVNRNRMLIDGKEHLFTVPVVDASQNRPINQHVVVKGWEAGLLEKVRHAYSRAPHYESVSRLVASVVQGASENLAMLALTSVVAVSRHLGLTTQFETSSCLPNPWGLRGQERIIDICGRMGADTYVNLPGGRTLYDPAAFADKGIELLFIPDLDLTYPQFNDPFVPSLSIIDALMFNDTRALQDHLEVLR